MKEEIQQEVFMLATQALEQFSLVTPRGLGMVSVQDLSNIQAGKHP